MFWRTVIALREEDKVNEPPLHVRVKTTYKFEFNYGAGSLPILPAPWWYRRTVTTDPLGVVWQVRAVAPEHHLNQRHVVVIAFSIATYIAEAPIGCWIDIGAGKPKIPVQP